MRGQTLGKESSCMAHYVFWPQHLKGRELVEKAGDLEAIAIALRGTDYVVIDVVPKGRLKASKLELPYSSIAVKYSDGVEWLFRVEVFQVVEFRAPNLRLLQFFSLDPISLTLPEKEIDASEEPLINANVVKLWEHPRYQAHDRRLRQTLSLLNLYHTHETAFREKYPRLSNLKEASGTRFWGSVKSLYEKCGFQSLINHIALYLTAIVCQIALYTYKALNWPYLKLVNISVMAQQIDLRCQQICYFPVQYLRINMNMTLRKALPRFRTYSEASANLRKDLPSNYYPDYIRFYNTVWLFLNDISFGLIFAAFLFEWCESFSKILHRIIIFCLYDLMKDVTVSLASNPLGIKLNEELAKFLSDLFLWIIEFSHSALLEPMANPETLSFFLKTVGNLGCLLGGTFALSVIADYFSILTIHVYIFYHISSKIYHWQISIMKSLFYLFTGKKRNVLRDRVDINFYQLDELLLGTIFFIILVFLTPTVLAFYYSFTVFRMVTIFFEIAVESVIALLNHFPLFALLLRMKDPRRIPGGISIRTVEGYPIRHELRNRPLSIGLMFKPYLALIDQMRETYFSPKTLTQILSGRPFVMQRNKLYRVLYSSLPRTPIEISALYSQLSRLLTRENS